MTKRHVLYGLALLGCCLVTNRVTGWLVRGEMRAEFHEAVDFDQYRAAFETFLAAHPLQDAEQVNGDRLPPPLAALGVVNVYRNGRFVYFVLPSTAFIGDRWTGEFIRQLERDERPVETILSTTKRATYHIQRLYSAPGWYYWYHD